MRDCRLPRPGCRHRSRRACCARQGHGRDARASRPRRLRRLGRPPAGVALGHRRLSIIDLSPLGHQPMPSADGRYVIAYQRRGLQLPRRCARSWRRSATASAAHSDTEVMLAAFSAWGAERALSALRRHVRLRAVGPADAHAPPGARPARQEAALLGASRRHAPVRLRAEGAAGASGLPRRRSTANALAAFLRYSYVPAPATIFTRRPQAAAGLDRCRLRAGGDADDRAPIWSPRRAGHGDRLALTRSARRTRSTSSRRCCAMRSRLRMIADVPLGAFLSGGIDSSTVVALMQAQSSRPVRTSRSASTRRRTTRRAYAGGRRASRHRPHRALRRRPTSARRHPAARRLLRRAVRRRLADPDLPRLAS